MATAVSVMYRVVFLKLIGVFSCMCRMLSESLFVFIGAAGIQTILQNVDGLQAALAAPASAPAAAPSPTPVCCFSCRSIFCTVMHHCGSLEAVKAVTPPPPPLTPTPQRHSLQLQGISIYGSFSSAHVQ